MKNTLHKQHEASLIEPDIINNEEQEAILDYEADCKTNLDLERECEKAHNNIINEKYNFNDELERR